MRIFNYIKNQSGQSTIFFALIIPIIIALLGLSIDIGHFLVKKQQMQDAVDFAALGAAQEIINNPGVVISKAKDIGEKNGLKRGDIKVTLDSSQKTVQVSYQENIPFFFIPILGIKSKENYVIAVAKVKTKSDPVFDYLLFSASQTKSFANAGSRNQLNGKVHINGEVKISGSGNKYNDTFEYSSKFDANPNNYFFSKSPSTVMPMPEYNINDYLSIATEKYSSSKSYSNGQFKGIIYVDGNVNISGTFKGEGIIVATGDISISASDVSFAASGTMGFFSLGNISISGSDSKFSGIFYAPNGEIALPGSRNIFTGSLIAQSLRLPGSDNQFNYDSRSKDTFFGSEESISLIK